ncbi:hypothetical protein NUW58_g2908 [Xylaria curta]|uniref:Uncharacterized protein n=1 Tax=Xylaria curta TaxID=42375 RepID=A0ACC1PDD4_9PEZI|nr:hypothetical protein NUW58_g2908 [Xylaria curta]
MANITADIEQLLAELVQITTKIAVLLNTAETDTSNDSDSLTSTANRLSLSAAIIAVAAFFIATLQAVLEYSSSGESARRKCNLAAIGPASQHVRKKWSFRHWRRKFYYPQLKIDPYRLFNSGSVSRLKSPRFTTRILTGAKRLLTIHRQVPNLESRPRATWAQLLVLNNVEDYWDTMTITYVDADSIPGSLDVPPQMVNLVELGRLLICMGYDSVRMNVQGRDFQAVGRFGSITTEELPGFGKIVRFQNYDTNRSLPTATPWEWVQAALNLIEGVFDINYEDIWLRTNRSGVVISRAMRNEADRMVSALNKTIAWKQHNIRFDDLYEGIKAMPNTSLRTAFTLWRDLPSRAPHYTKYPGILITLAVAGLPCAVAGFPGRLLLIPFLDQFRQISQTIYEQRERALSELSFSGLYIIGSLKPSIFPEAKGDIAYSSLLASLGLSHWAFDETEYLNKYTANPKMIQLYFKLMRAREPWDTEGEWLFRQWRVVLTPTVDLIKNFDPRFWAQSSHYQSQRVDLDGTDIHCPIEMLKTQIILLDISIQYLLQRMWKSHASQIPFMGTGSSYLSRLLSPGTFIFHIMEAISKSITDGNGDESGPFQCLDEALFSELVANTSFTKEDREHVSQLADFLGLRVVLYAAYLMIIPDTSDILDTLQSAGLNSFILPMI